MEGFNSKAVKLFDALSNISETGILHGKVEKI